MVDRTNFFGCSVARLVKRLYCVARLNHTIVALKNVESIKNFKEQAVTKKITFANDKITACVLSLEKSDDISPLLLLWNSVTRDELLEDDLFISEFIKLLFVVYKNIYSNSINMLETDILVRHKKNFLEKINALYVTLEKMPLEQLLATIDLIVEELPKVLDTYEFYSEMSWKDWFKKFWWVIPLVSTTFGIRIILLFARPFYGYSSYLSSANHSNYFHYHWPANVLHDADPLHGLETITYV